MNDFTKTGGTIPPLNELLESYRRIGRSGSLQEKIQLLRQLRAAEPGNPEWAEHLRPLEENYQKELAAAAKAAIIAENFDELRAVLNIFISQPWLNNPNPAVLSKIKNVLNQHHQEKVRQDVRKKLEEITAAYSRKELPALMTAVNEYDQLIARVPGAALAADSAEVAIVNEVKKYISTQLRKNAEDAEYNRLVQTLKHGLFHDEPLAKMEKCILAIQSMGRAVPMELMVRFGSCQEEEEAIMRKKKFLRIVCGIFTALVILAALGFGGYLFLMFQQEKQWCNKLDTAIISGTGDQGLKLLDELAVQYPRMRYKTKILDKEKLIKEKKTAEDLKRNNFAVVAEKVEVKLRQFERYRKEFPGLLKAMKENIVDDKEETRFNELNQRCESELINYKNKQNATYMQKEADLKVEFRLLEKSLVEKNISAIVNHKKNIDRIKQEMTKMEDVSDELRKASEEVLKQNADIEKQLEELKKEQLQEYEKKQFSENIRELTNLSSRFENAVDKEQFADAENFLKQIMSLYSEIQSMTTIPGEVMVKHDQFFKSLETYPGKFDKAKAEYDARMLLERKRQALLESLPQCKSFSEFAQMVESCYVRQENIATVMPGIDKLYDNCKTAVAVMEQKFDSITVFARDMNLLHELKKQQFKKGFDLIGSFRKTFPADGYMLVAEGSDNSLCTVYFSKVAENKDNPGNIRLHNVLGSNDRLINVTVQYNKTANTVRITDKDGFDFSGILIYPDDFSCQAPSFINLYRDALLDVVDRDAESAAANAEELLCNDIDAIARDARIHPCLKLILINERLSILSRRDSGYLAWQQDIKNIQRELGRNARWQMRGSVKNIPDVDRRIAGICEKYKSQLPFAAVKRRIGSLELVKNRKLIPAGFMLVGVDGQASQFYRFKEAPQTGEFWILQDNKFTVCGRYAGNSTQINPVDFNCRVVLVFTPTDGQNTVGLQEELESFSTPLPDSWPILMCR